MKDHDVVDTEVIERTEPVAAEWRPSREHIAAFLEYTQRKHNSQCRKPGFKDHFHQPAGSSLGRRLAKDGSIYGPRSIVQQSFDNIQKQKWDLSGKAAKYAEVGAQRLQLRPQKVAK